MSDYIELNFIQVFTDNESPGPDVETVVDVGTFVIDRIHILGDAVYIHGASENDDRQTLIIRNSDDGRPRLFVSPIELINDVEAFDLPS